MSELRYRLYERAVQTPDFDVEVLGRLFRRRAGRAACTLREDFCGTALLSARWVESHDDREAVGVDHDRRVLAYARKKNVAPLEDDADRLTLTCGDVREKSDRTFDLIAAMNFSWAIFDDAELDSYLANAAACLEDDGMLVLELFGGRDMERPLVREHHLDGLTYTWEQRSFDRGVLDARIHFCIGQKTLRDAFRYRFRLRALPVLRARLERAGFCRVELLVEDRRGRYGKRSQEPRSALWRGLVIARRG